MPALLALLLAPSALAYDTFLYYDSTLIPAANVSSFSAALTAAGASVYTTTSSAWPTNYTGYRLAIFLMPATSFTTPQANALTTFVNGGGRMIISGDWYSAGSGFLAWNNNVNGLMGSMGVPMFLNNTVVSGSGCSSSSNITADSVTSGVSQVHIAASNTVSGGTTLVRFAGSSVLSVSQPSTSTHARDPYDVVLSGDVNIFLNDCVGTTTAGRNTTIWTNIYNGTCSDDDSDGHDDAACGGDDCDDSDNTIYPGAPETCDGDDDDCDGSIDEGAAGASTWYADSDADGYGNPTVSTTSCTQPSGYVSGRTDCADADATAYPGALEYCDGVDDDCDGAIDDSAVDMTDWYRDFDSDGWGDTNSTSTSCNQPSGYVSLDGDCNDRSATLYPGAAEIPYDGIDQDCDGSDLTDRDGDGYGAVQAGGTDCWDTEAGVYPGAAEVADGVDGDCDGTVDDGTAAWDDDGDGYTEEGGDCNDASGSVSPAGTEIVDGLDQDCDGLVDDGTAAYDDDHDGYTEVGGDCNDGDSAANPARPEVPLNGIDDDCDGATDVGFDDLDGDGYAPEGGDCDDSRDDVHPGAAEVGDGVDNDCDTVIDEDTDARDDDGDGFSERDGDCNDADPTMLPAGGEEANGRDDNCDGVTDEGTDAFDDDGDGVAEAGGDCDDDAPTVYPGAPEVPDTLDNDCNGEIDDVLEDMDGDGVTLDDGDCDDDNGWVWPGNPELCDGLDNNCDGQIDEVSCEPLEEDKISTSNPSCASNGASGSLSLLLSGLCAAALLSRRR